MMEETIDSRLVGWREFKRTVKIVSHFGGEWISVELIPLLFKINGHLYSAYRLNQSEVSVLKWFVFM